jgi:SAM-dependent methyltransferase
MWNSPKNENRKMKTVAESCERNKQSILEVLKPAFSDRTAVLEVGSGTGQHAVHFGEGMPHLTWQTSDLPANHPGIQAWLDEASLSNVLPPLALDVRGQDWPIEKVDAIFTANTLHIVSWEAVQAFFDGVGRVLEPEGLLAIYGPFNYGGNFSSESNAKFDIWLKDRDPVSGIRDFEAIEALAMGVSLELVHDFAMPANNRILLWRKSG